MGVSISNKSVLIAVALILKQTTVWLGVLIVEWAIIRKAGIRALDNYFDH
jgi:hypothetical protein